MKTFFSRNKIYRVLVLIGAIVFLVTYFFLNREEGLPAGVETGIVTRGQVLEVINETGFVQGVHSVDLAFQVGGNVESIRVAEGDVVKEGDVLAVLENTRAKSEVTSAYARLRAEEARLDELLAGADISSRAVYERAIETAQTALENAKNNLAQVTAQQNVLVENARRTLQSSSLQAVLRSEKREDTNYVYTPPTITGTYTGEEGTYMLTLYRSNAPSGSSLTYKGIEQGTGEVSTIAPTPLGTKGLYVQFPNNFAPNTEWDIIIPNTKSSAYLSNMNAYTTAVKTRDLAIASAESAVRAAESALAQARVQFTQVSGPARDERISAQRALIEQMRALVAQANTSYENTSIKAPFSGTVMNINMKQGETVGGGVPVIGLVSESAFEVAVNLSEVDIAEVGVGDRAKIMLDAYDGVVFEGTVNEVAPRISVVNGVRVIPITIALETEDPRMKDGFTAQVDIYAADRNDVLIIPSRAVYEDDNGKYVWVVQSNTSITRVPVKTGLRGTNGVTEIVEGLQGGERIITFANTTALAKLKTP